MTADITACNVIVHVIGSALLPSSDVEELPPVAVLALPPADFDATAPPSSAAAPAPAPAGADESAPCTPGATLLDAISGETETSTLLAILEVRSLGGRHTLVHWTCVFALCIEHACFLSCRTAAG